MSLLLEVVYRLTAKGRAASLAPPKPSKFERQLTRSAVWNWWIRSFGH